ncbi:MAG: TlpA disulfide reductase family protein [Saprospiraceae bacterium]|nr:TlpA disulfide reductase family protein [Saprospiraceae bacterium]
MTTTFAQNKIFLLIAIIAIVVNSGCFVAENPYTGLAPGYWRAVLTLDPVAASTTKGGTADDEEIPNRIDRINSGELPFTFEVKYENDTKFYIEIINGEERIRLDDIVIGRDKRIAKDTIVINFPVFDSYIKGIYHENIIQGEWVVNNRNVDYRIPFVARQGLSHRFTKMKETPTLDATGRWEVTFSPDTEDEEKGIGEFVQKGNNLNGTFMTETGDHRFLEGTVQGDKLYLSAFDGSHAYLFEAKIQADSTLFGTWWSGKHYTTTWTARRNSEFRLGNADSLTYLNPGYDKFTFAFKNPDGKTISLDDPKYQDKIKIVQIMGTWCPNCRDETEFLLDYLKNNPNDDLEIIGLAFERHNDESKARAAILKYKEFFGIDYEILYAGSDVKTKASKALPMLNRVISFPTMIFIDRQNKVRRIHTGFSGPATSEYQNFKQKFDTFIKELMAEEL